MNFERRQDSRKRDIARVMLAAQALAFLYMSLHAAVTALAYKFSGFGEALLTFVTLGFGDLYWAVRWFMEGGQTQIAVVAGAAATACFASWLGRPYFNRWANALTAGMLSDAADELERITASRPQPGDTTHDEAPGGPPDRDRADGGPQA